MNVLHPNGMVERMDRHLSRRTARTRYGRRKEGGPKNAETWKIASDNDRRSQSRDDEDHLRGRLLDLNA